MTAAASTSAGKTSGKAAFFRQGGWMMLATIIGGVLTWAVHLFSKKIPDSEYGTLITLLSVVNLAPTMPLQMVFAQQTSLAQASRRGDQLSALMRGTALGIFLAWMATTMAVMAFRQGICLHWHVANPAALPALLLVILLSVGWPVLGGVMQGGQNFLWLGWCYILNGAGRIAAAAVVVLAWHGYAAGIMAGIGVGLALACAIGAWQTRGQWLARPGKFESAIIVKQALPLMLGFAATQFLFSADTPFVNAYFGPDRTAPYGAAGTLSRALLWLVLPLANVMFPKIVHSHARAEHSNLLGLTMALTGGLAGAGFLGLWLTGPWVIPLIFKGSFSAQAMAVLPWYAGAMIPLVLGNVLVNDLLARARYGLVPWLVILAGAYGFVLTRFHDSPTRVLQIMGLFNLLMLALCGAFAWRGKKRMLKF